MPKLISKKKNVQYFSVKQFFFSIFKVCNFKKTIFMTTDLKQKLHKLIDSCNDEFLLEEARAVLESPQTAKEFFDELDEEDREEFLEAEEEHEKGHTVTHNRVMHQFEEWKKK